MSFTPNLSRRLDLEAALRTPDGLGGFSVTWQKLGTLPAAVVARSGRERLVGDRDLSRTAFRITVRASPVGAPSRPKPDQRFRDGARLYEIKAVAENPDSALYLDCWVEEEGQI